MNASWTISSASARRPHIRVGKRERRTQLTVEDHLERAGSPS